MVRHHAREGFGRAVIALVLFIVFLALWACTLLPSPQNPVAPYGGVFAWLSVLMLAICAHVIHFG
jgi:hypothetical protein